MFLDKLIHEVDSLAKEKRWKIARLAREADVHPATLKGFPMDGWSANVTSLRKLESLLLRERPKLTVSVSLSDSQDAA